jgi:hypothetical protein
MKKLLYLLLLIPLVAATTKKESDYQKAFCRKGEAEYVLDDSTRVDCLLDEYAVEIDFGRKWAECVGQSLHYAYKTGKMPACALIVNKKGRDMRYLRRLENLAEAYDIKVFVIWK